MSIVTPGGGSVIDSRHAGAYGPSGGGGTPILLPDLVAGWALTAGPQQTLDSTGVIASGPYDLSENSGPLTYGATGVVLNGIDQFLSHASTADLVTGDIDFTFSAEVIVDDDTLQGDIGAKGSDFGDGEWDLLVSPSSGAQAIFYPVPAFVGPQAGNVIPEATARVVTCWYNAAAGTANLKVGSGATASEAVDPPGATAGDFKIGVGAHAYFLGKIRYARFWRRLLTADELTFVNAGRTDAEIAAYTG